MIPRFFLPEINLEAQSAIIHGEDAHHLIGVLRRKPGDKIELIDGLSKCYLAEIISGSAEKVDCKILHTLKINRELPAKITLLQCLPKSGKMDWIIEKCTELGITKIIPTISSRSVPKLDQEKSQSRVRRWNKIARSAAEQSGREIIPEVADPLPLPQAVTLGGFAVKLMAFEGEKEQTLKNVLAANPSPTSVAILIGPEGGLSRVEAELARENHYLPVSLGKRILRTETAGMFVLSALVYALEL